MFDADVRASLLAAAALALLAASCGGAEHEPNLARASERTEASGSSSFSLRVAESVGGRSQAYRCEGAADYTAERMRLSCGDDGEFIAIGDTYYARGWSTMLALPSGRPWVRVPIEEDDGGSPFDFAPNVLLARLRAASLDTERLGSEDVRGQETVRYRMTVRCEDADLGCAETTDVEVWIDDEGLVRRASLEDNGADITAEYFDFGIAVDVAEPPADEIADLVNPSLGSCPGGGAPISDQRLRQALRRHGLDPVDGSGECLTGVAAQVAAADRDSSSPSVVLCHVQGAAGAGSPATVEAVSSPGVAGLRLRNVQCASYGADPSGGDAIRRLRAALEELERELRP